MSEIVVMKNPEGIVYVVAKRTQKTISVDLGSSADTYDTEYGWTREDYARATERTADCLAININAYLPEENKIFLLADRGKTHGTRTTCTLMKNESAYTVLDAGEYGIYDLFRKKMLLTRFGVSFSDPVIKSIVGLGIDTKTSYPVDDGKPHYRYYFSKDCAPLYPFGEQGPYGLDGGKAVKLEYEWASWTVLQANQVLVKHAHKFAESFDFEGLSGTYKVANADHKSVITLGEETVLEVDGIILDAISMSESRILEDSPEIKTWKLGEVIKALAPEQITYLTYEMHGELTSGGNTDKQDCFSRYDIVLKGLYGTPTNILFVHGVNLKDDKEYVWRVYSHTYSAPEFSNEQGDIFSTNSQLVVIGDAGVSDFVPNYGSVEYAVSSYVEKMCESKPEIDPSLVNKLVNPSGQYVYEKIGIENLENIKEYFVKLV